jgi:hypothetical protein
MPQKKNTWRSEKVSNKYGVAKKENTKPSCLNTRNTGRQWHFKRYRPQKSLCLLALPMPVSTASAHI